MHSNNNTGCGFKELNSVFSGVSRYLNYLILTYSPKCILSFLSRACRFHIWCVWISTQTGEVTLTCELHGYQSSLSPPVWLDLGGSEITATTKYTITSGEGGNTIVFENGTAIPSVIVSLTIRDLSLADGGTYTCRGVRGGESVTQLVILEGTAPPTTPPPPTTAPPLTSQRSLAPSNVLLPTVYGLVSIVTILVIALLLLIVFIVYLLRKKINKIKNSLIRSTEAVQVPNSLSIQEREDTSISVQDVTYEEIAERSVMSLTKNEAYVCVSTPLEK